MRAIFFISAGLMFYAYAGYPVLLAIIGAIRSEPESGPNAEPEEKDWPSLSVIVAAYNEESVITQRVENFTHCEYAGESELIVVSDGSNDRTAEIVAGFGSNCVRVIKQSTRQGKGVAVNVGAAHANGEILVFSDANAMFDRNALAALVGPFHNPRVGLVTGISRYPDGTIGSAYQRYELMLKRLESRMGAIATADGAIYAMRRSLFRELDPVLINDFTHPILVALQGFDSVLAADAVCREDFSSAGEFARQVRMVSQAALVYFRFIPSLIRDRRWRSIAILTSHKMLRWLTAPILAAAVLSTLALAPQGGIYGFALLAELALALVAVAGFAANRMGLDSKATFVYQFVTLNCAQAIGLWRCFSGQVPVVWKPRDL
ncbi:MAG TPA: glycosyltransferase [Candidatus Binataceae bacterium]|nr:glycosyltransferase [Candidatus Binataceae bacterium]